MKKSQILNLVEMFEHQAQALAKKTIYTFLPGKIDEPLTLSYEELHQNSILKAAQLQKRFQIGDRVLLLFPCDLEYIQSFIACLYAGLVPIPLYPPNTPTSSEKVNRVAEDSQARGYLSTKELRSKMQLSIEGICWDELPENKTWQKPNLNQNSVAFIQYTSGSTGNPKGVVLSHGNLLSNFEMIAKTMKAKSDDVIVSWLPMYHDMGLIGAILHTAFTGMTTVLMPPATVVRPLKWLSAISHYKGTVTVAPNFGYDLCVEKISVEQAKGLDLSRLRAAFNGAEPVRWKTQKAFQDKFSITGLASDIFLSCYGLAEATLIVSGRDLNEPSKYILADNLALQESRVVLSTESKSSRQLVSCGPVCQGMDVAIFDHGKNFRLEAFHIGEVLIAGPNVTQGYWNKESDQRNIKLDDKIYFRTGDLGFFDESQQLYITGRVKDIIIVRGKNYSPSDIEYIARLSNSSISSFMNAAFSVDSGSEETVILLQEIRGQYSDKDLQTFSESIIDQVSQEMGLHISLVQFVKMNSLLRTSSGKIRRSEIKQQYLNHKIQFFEK